MENNEMQDQWVDRRMASLEPPKAWQPNATRGMARFRERQRAYRTRRKRWTWAAVAASVAALGLFLLAPARCSGAGCDNTSDRPSAAAFEGPAAPPEPQAPRPVPAQPVAGYKESGNRLAPITIELFTDYECPHCATVYLQVVPELVKDYVRTGKVKLVHRDFPLNQHQFARLAARYANAAGTLGHYETVVNQIFKTQATWTTSGDVGTQVAQVLPRDVMDKVRNLVQNDAHLDDSINADVAIGRQDQLNQTPTMVVAYKGKRQLLAPIPHYELLKSYLDDLRAK